MAAENRNELLVQKTVPSETDVPKLIPAMGNEEKNGKSQPTPKLNTANKSEDQEATFQLRPKQTNETRFRGTKPKAAIEEKRVKAAHGAMGQKPEPEALPKSKRSSKIRRQKLKTVDETQNENSKKKTLEATEAKKQSTSSTQKTKKAKKQNTSSTQKTKSVSGKAGVIIPAHAEAKDQNRKLPASPVEAQDWELTHKPIAATGVHRLILKAPLMSEISSWEAESQDAKKPPERGVQKPTEIAKPVQKASLLSQLRMKLKFDIKRLLRDLRRKTVEGIRYFKEVKIYELCPCLIVDQKEWDYDLPMLFITEMIMPDEIDLETDEDRMGKVHLQGKRVNRIQTLGGTPICLQVVNGPTWTPFLPRARPPFRY